MSTRRETVELDRFDVEDDQGDILEVVEVQPLIYTAMLSGQQHVTKGIKALMLSSGQPVNFIDKNTFKIVNDGRIVHRIDGI